MANLVKFNLVDSVKQHIFAVRGHRVMLDRDLAQLYGVTTKRLNEQFTRNRHRFPPDFAFQLKSKEIKSVTVLRSQNATLKRGQHFKHPPNVFTEHGAIMLASILNSRVAVQASIYVVRAFVEMRGAALAYAEVSHRIDLLEQKYDRGFREVFDAIRELMSLPPKERLPIGFVHGGKSAHKA